MKNLAMIIKWLTLLALAAGVIWLISWMRHGKEEIPPAQIEAARVIDVRPMVKLCSVEVYEDIPIKARIGKRHIFARTTLRGNISFDLEKTRSRWSGDTLVVTLPPEKVEIYESTESGAYKVIDTWNDQLLGSSNFTTAEENEIKRRVVAAWRDSIYARGYVKRARREAVANLKAMLGPFAEGKEIRVEDLQPEGVKN